MKDLAIRLAALDPDASAALRVIAHFDRLNDAHAGLPTIVREAALLTGFPARLVDDDRRLSVRFESDGVARAPSAPASPDWLVEPLPGTDSASLWLERPGPASPVEAVVLERAAAAAAAVLRRIPGASSRSPNGDRAYVDLVLDATATEPDRLRAARRLGFSSKALARAVAVRGAPPCVEPVPPALPIRYRAQRAGIGPAVPVIELPRSYAAARTALRFTAEGTSCHPGPRIVAYEELGGLVLLATAVGPDTRPVPDVAALVAVTSTAPWVLATLAAVAENSSLRAAACALRVHHSTLQERLTTIEHQLGWTVRDPHGRLRLQLALTLRRLHQYAE